MSFRLRSPGFERRGNNSEKCPRCGKGPLAEDSNTGEFYCTNCGYVVKERLEETKPEWRSFPDEQGGESRARTGMPTSITSFDMGLSTVIGSSNRDASGSSLSGHMKSTMDRVRVWDKRSQAKNSFDRNLRQAFNEMKMFAEKLAVGDEVVERASYIYRKAVERGVTRGRSIIQISAAALYAACRDMAVPRTLKDVAAVSNVAKKDLARSYRILVREMDLRMPVPDPIRSVSRIASRAGVGEKTQRRALEILAKAHQKEVVAGKDPMGLAAAALYVASTLESSGKTQKDIADAASITEVTLRNRYKGLRQALGI
ncbi:MAG: transcription initiation factor IIB [Thaumarchaeota archaeon]|nr:transcription initiation factor IIB [Nitrososphaerota archaeon]